MIIALSGKINSGKSLTGKLLQYHLAANNDRTVLETSLDDWGDDCQALSKVSGFEHKSFAGNIKKVAAIVLGCTVQDLENREFKEAELGAEWGYPSNGITAYDYPDREFLTPRILMQLIGTECGRNTIHPNIWINSLLSQYRRKEGKYPSWIITDMRFKNDDAKIKSLGGIRIRIERQLNQKGDAIHEHSSETELDDVTDFDEIIVNDGDIEELRNTVKNILNQRGIVSF